MSTRWIRGLGLISAASVWTLSGCGNATEEAGSRVLALDVGDCPPGSNVIVGTEGDDVLVGTSGNDCIVGRGGNDTIVGGSGADTIFAGSGDDSVDGGNGDDRIFGEGGDDVVDGGNGNDVVDGGDGNDVVTGGTGSDVVDGGAGNDILGGDNGNDTVRGGDGNDVIRPGNGTDLTDGGSGTDSCSTPSCETPVAGLCSVSEDCASDEQSCVGGVCVFCVADSECDDGAFCTGVEQCSPATGCVAGTPRPLGTSSGETCSTGVGACFDAGEMICDGTGSSFCDAVAGTPTPDDVCNGIDDDCDGSADEDFVERSVSCGVGECQDHAIPRCEGGVIENPCVPGTPATVDACDGRDEDCNGLVDDGTLDSDADGQCDERDRCPFHPQPDLTAGDVVTGFVVVLSPDDDTPTLQFPLQSFRVETSLGRTSTDCEGRYTYVVPPGSAPGDGPFEVHFVYDNNVPGPAGSSTNLRIMDDLKTGWGGGIFHTGFSRSVLASADTIDGHTSVHVQPVVLSTSEAELWRIGINVVNDYQSFRNRGTQHGKLEYMRRAAAFDTTPFTFFDYVDLASNILTMGLTSDRGSREFILFHESGHVFRDVADGDDVHFFGDVVNFMLARCHFGVEISEEPYAFHEGWAGYYSEARRNGHRLFGPGGAFAPLVTTAGPSPTTTNYCEGLAGPRGLALTPGHMDWVENMVADRLLALACCAGTGSATCTSATDPALLAAGDDIMVATLEANRGTLHSLIAFENALCGTTPGACCGLVRPAPPPCPPTYTNAGLTCIGPDSHSIRRYP